jgi:hypothetical protein
MPDASIGSRASILSADLDDPDGLDGVDVVTVVVTDQ